MPWCDACSKYHAPTALRDGRCPVCGGAVESSPQETAAEDDLVGHSAPWHFWLVVIALAGYLLWRVIDAVMWAIR